MAGTGMLDYIGERFPFWIDLTVDHYGRRDWFEAMIGRPLVMAIDDRPTAAYGERPYRVHREGKYFYVHYGMNIRYYVETEDVGMLVALAFGEDVYRTSWK